MKWNPITFPILAEKMGSFCEGDKLLLKNLLVLPRGVFLGELKKALMCSGTLNDLLFVRGFMGRWNLHWNLRET